MEDHAGIREGGGREMGGRWEEEGRGDGRRDGRRGGGGGGEMAGEGALRMNHGEYGGESWRIRMNRGAFAWTEFHFVTA